MKINSHYEVIALDERSLALMQKRVTTDKKTGEKKESWKPVAYASTVSQMLESLARRELYGTGFKDLETVLKKFDELEDLIKRVCGKPMTEKVYDELIEKTKSKGKPVKEAILKKGSKK